MTSLLLGTFVISGLHTLLWLPKALQMRRELRSEEARAKAETSAAALLEPKAAGEDGTHAG
jgi:hypothetical protein